MNLVSMSFTYIFIPIMDEKWRLSGADEIMHMAPFHFLWDPQFF
jgi:hypothetical protein